MKLSEYKNEDALELLADILDPVSAILADAGLQKIISKQDATKIEVVQYLLRKHPKEVIAVLARLDGTPVDKYEVNILSLPKKLLDIFNDDELVYFFRSQGQMRENGSFGSATENIGATDGT